MCLSVSLSACECSNVCFPAYPSSPFSTPCTLRSSLFEEKWQESTEKTDYFTLHDIYIDELNKHLYKLPVISHLKGAKTCIHSDDYINNEMAIC